jgi:apolipoprotein N-acyltransferase
MLAVLLGSLPAAWLEGEARAWRPLAAGVALLGAVWAGGALRLMDAQTQAVAGVRLRLVQANIPQALKWQPEARAQAFQRHLSLSGAGADGVTHLVWPESATPYPPEQDAVAREMMAAVIPQGGLLLTGGERFDPTATPPRAWNSLFVIDGNGAVRARYDKRDLVPFGEFLPLRGVLGRLGLGKLTHGSIDFQAGPGRTTIALEGLPPASPLICYEAIFPGGVVDRAARPDWLLNVTNDAWFGRSTGPYQHFAMARMRAIEEGLPLVRSANSGVSAVVDPWGRVQAELGLGATGVLDAALPQPLPGPTPFARLGLAVVAAPAAALALGAVLLEARRRRVTPAVHRRRERIRI